MMKHFLKKILVLGGVLVLSLALAAPVLAAPEAPAGDEPAAVTESQTDNTVGLKSIAVALAIGIAAGGGGIGMGLAATFVLLCSNIVISAGGAIAMGMAIAKSVDGISRQPEAEGKIRTMMMLGLVFIETAIIYALLVVILIIFVL